MWQQKNVTLEGIAIIFKTLSLSKFVFLAQVSLIPIVIFTSIQRI